MDERALREFLKNNLSIKIRKDFSGYDEGQSYEVQLIMQSGDINQEEIVISTQNLSVG